MSLRVVLLTVKTDIWGFLMSRENKEITCAFVCFLNMFQMNYSGAFLCPEEYRRLIEVPTSTWMNSRDGNLLTVNKRPQTKRRAPPTNKRVGYITSRRSHRDGTGSNAVNSITDDSYRGMKHILVGEALNEFSTSSASFMESLKDLNVSFFGNRAGLETQFRL